MKTFIVQELRKRSAVVGKQKTWVSDLSDHELLQLYEKLRAGESSRAVAKHIQQRWKLQDKSEVHSVAQGITKFRKRVSDLLALQLEQDPEEKKARQNESLTELEWSDSLLRLETITKMAGERVEAMLLDEKRGIKHPGLSKDLQSLGALQKELLREKEFALAHPGEDLIKKRQDQIRDRRMEKNFNKMMASLPDEGERVVQAIDRFLEKAAEIAVPIAYDTDTGVYQVVEKEDS